MQARIARLYAALGAVNQGSDAISVTTDETPSGARTITVGPNETFSSADLENQAAILISNIASLKDHLKAWCKLHNKSFEGDALINSNKDVALVHDLWNRDKHAVLDKPTRSGHRPYLGEIERVMQFSTPATPGSSAFVDVLMDGEDWEIVESGGGRIQVILHAHVLDDDGSRLADLHSLCERAISAWESTIKRAGAI